MKILICDDHEIIRLGIKNMLEPLTTVSNVMLAENGNNALSLVKLHDFDIVILDISLPDINGLEVLKLIKDSKPATKVIILSINTQKQYATRALNRKASGYLTKDVLTSELISAIKKAMNNEIYISSTMAANFVSHDKNNSSSLNNRLSEREFEVLDLLGIGKKNKEICILLNLSPKTVHTHKGHIMHKMGFKTIADLIHYYKENRADPNSLL